MNQKTIKTLEFDKIAKQLSSHAVMENTANTASMVNTVPMEEGT